jgi:hypothetical protein
VLAFDRQTIGFKQIERESFWKFLQRHFSRKCAANPMHFKTLARLFVPNTFLVPLVLRIWRDATWTILRAFVGSVHL